MNIARPFDSRLEHRATGSAALTSTTVIGTVNQHAAGRTDYVTIVGVESIDIASGDELYKFVVEVSDDDFATVAEVAAIRELGATGARQSGAPNSAAGDRLEIPWSTEVNGKTYKDWRLKLFVSGASPSIEFYSFSAPRKP